MTNLKTANIGYNKYCGPAVLSILTGKSTDECARVISRFNRAYDVKGVLLNDLLKAADVLGFDSKDYPYKDYSLYRTLTFIAKDAGIYIITLEQHFVVVEISSDGKLYFCDNHTKEPIPAASSARMMQKVVAVNKVTERKKKIYKTIEKYLEEEFSISLDDFNQWLIDSGRISSSDEIKLSVQFPINVFRKYTETEQVEVL